MNLIDHIKLEMAKPEPPQLLLHPPVDTSRPRVWTRWDRVKHRVKWECAEWRERIKHARLALRGYRVDYWDDD